MALTQITMLTPGDCIVISGTMAVAVVIACAAGLGTWMGVLADAESVLGSSTNLAPCVTEDSDNCYWLADESGNLEGRSFVTIDGEVFYLDGAR